MRKFLPNWFFKNSNVLTTTNRLTVGSNQAPDEAFTNISAVMLNGQTTIGIEAATELGAAKKRAIMYFNSSLNFAGFQSYDFSIPGPGPMAFLCSDILSTSSLLPDSSANYVTSTTTLGTTSTSLCSLSLGSLGIGTTFLVFGTSYGNKGATAGVNQINLSRSGTATIQATADDQASYFPASFSGAQLSVCSVMRVTAAGTCTIVLYGQSYGSTTTGASNKLAVEFLKKF